jgi:hypothetical protein
LDLTFHPLTSRPNLWVRVDVQPGEGGNSLEIAYSAAEDTVVGTFHVLDDALWTTNAEKGYLVVPVRMGLLIPADSGQTFTHEFNTNAYEGCHMEMLGIVKKGAAALVTWDDPYVAADIKSEMPPSGELAGKQVLSTSLVLSKSAKRLRILFLGQGDYVTIGKAYRQLAARRGLLVRWSDKIKANPERAKLLGAINYKLWAVLQREMNEESSEQQVLKVNWTFEQAAQVAEHLKNDLKLDKVLFGMGGWIHRGYDNQHPDILPAAPECGGNEALAECARRVMRQDYLICLHDNYQDIYRDSPSWNEELIMKHPDGSLVKGGHWWGGRAYLICSEEAIRLAKRPQNLPAVKEITHANAYFIDTTYASNLQECFDPRHPLTRLDDRKGKQALSDYAREMFGVFGSEDGREWAIPHCDFFEGLTGVGGSHLQDKKLMSETSGASVPLFEIVYRDTIALYGKYAFDVSLSAEYVLYHLSIGRTLNYHGIPHHLYWKQMEFGASPSQAAMGGSARDPALFTRADGGWADGLHPFDRFVKNTYETLSPLNELTAQMQLTAHQFLTSDRKVQRTVFGEGPEWAEVIVNMSDQNYLWESHGAGTVLLPPYGFLVESPTFAAFHALSWNGLTYQSAPLFTLRSRDGVPLSHSAKVRVYHGFGDPRVRLGSTDRTVEKEAVLSTRAPMNSKRRGRAD